MSEAPLVVVMAATGQPGLPQRPFEELAGMALVEFQLRRLQPVRQQTGAALVVLTTDLPADDPLADLLERRGIAVVRGPADDALGSLAIAHVRFPGDAIVRLGGDAPFSDPFVVLAALELHRSAGADHTSNLLPRTYPRGLEVEVLSARALRTSVLEVDDPGERMRGTSFWARRPDRFRLASLHSGHDLAEERWAVETAADLARARDIVAQVPDVLDASWNRILSVVGRTNRPRPGQVVLQPQAPPEPGSTPWTRTWQVLVDGAPVGTAQVSCGDGRTRPEVHVADAWREPAREALYRLLLDDPQAAV